HKYLLPAYFSDDKKASSLTSYVKKPLFSREGANVEIVTNGEVLETADGPYGVEGSIIQEYVPLPVFDGNHVVVGSWIVGDTACGLNIREDHSRITQDLSRFYPHAIVG
ncbi:MAG TPA: glutathionylspermidine synthase family protein, partial [Candidatus Ignatzschineria merdigallinarum]|nr:glutathionylspermidine synthase family protein [Candidatus Ignatzschineria merdigallinarum]